MHAFDVLHRDIKPSNFIIRPDGIVKVMDLGLAQEVRLIPKQKSATVGTPYYMAPELLQNPGESNQRVDIYALGVSFYRLLTGEYPITGDTPKEILKNILEQVPLPVTQHVPEISPEIDQVIQKMLAKDPKQRYQNMTDVLNDLDRITVLLAYK
jgi:serine/threonine-protein kinase